MPVIPLQDNIPRRNPPLMTWALIFVNLVVFLVELRLGKEQLQTLFYTLGIVPARFTHPAWAEQVGLPVDDWWPYLTSMFLHGGWWHLIGNMWFLWLFGDNVEDRMGPWRFLSFYLVCGIVAALVHTWLEPTSTLPTVGASGAIAGVMGGYLLLFPTARMIMMIPIFIFPFFFELPAALFLLFWFLIQLTSGFASIASVHGLSPIAWWAHVGGFAAGVIGVMLFCPRPCRARQRDEMSWDSLWSHRR